MDKAFERSRTETVQKLDYRKKISDHIAYALLVYTGLHIFVTVSAMKGDGASILPFLALVLLIGGIIPALRWFEKRWSKLSDEQASDRAHLGKFRRDVLVLWLLAIGLPFGLTALFKAITSVV